MEGIADFQDKHTLDSTTLAGGRKRQHTRRNIAITLWIIGFLALMVASVIAHLHPAPWPIDLQTTITLQHLQLPFWVSTPIVWASIVDDVLPSLITFIVWFVVLSLIGVVVWHQGGSPIPWFVTAIFVSLGSGVMNALDGLIGMIVSRPRPSSPLIHISMPVAVHSFPSGHVENDVVYLGFVLYLSLSRPVCQWRYRWVLIPFQLYAVLNILLIGYSRVLEGSHWLTDVLGGYLAGALWLVLLILLYCWTLGRLTKWHAKRLQEKPAQTQEA